MNIRRAQSADAATIAGQRGQMFVDMGQMTVAEAAAEQELWAAWLQSALAAGEYVGFLAEVDGEVVGGVGVMLLPKLPTLGDPAALKGHILNMSVSPGHRRRGYAEALMQAALQHLRDVGLASVSLNAAPMGRQLYERLGFVEASSPEMRLTLQDVTR